MGYCKKKEAFDKDGKLKDNIQIVVDKYGRTRYLRPNKCQIKKAKEKKDKMIKIERGNFIVTFD